MNDDFYDDMAESYHLIFQDWDAAIQSQSDVIGRLLSSLPPHATVLDCSCGIGTQAIGLAMRGFKVEGSDPSQASITRASREAAARHLSAVFRVDDMRTLATAEPNRYDAVIAMDNALPHLQSDEEITAAFSSMRSRLRTDGVLLISLRDYAVLLDDRPAGTPPAFYRDGPDRRIVHQIWDWQDDCRYVVHLFITVGKDGKWQTRHFSGLYRAVTPSHVQQLMLSVGFRNCRILKPEETGYYQPVLTGIH